MLISTNLLTTRCDGRSARTDLPGPSCRTAVRCLRLQAFHLSDPCSGGVLSPSALACQQRVCSCAVKLCACVRAAVQADDIERPAQLPPDQLPVMAPAQPSADSPQRHTDQLPTTAPVSTSVPGGSRSTASQQAAPQAARGGRHNTHRAQPGTSSHRRRW
jgi:hypothetical protein